jgi:hypothetical protein
MKTPNQAMGTFKTLPTTAMLSDLCAKQRHRELIERSPTAARYKMEKEDGRILLMFDKEYVRIMHYL